MPIVIDGGRLSAAPCGPDKRMPPRPLPGAPWLQHAHDVRLARTVQQQGLASLLVRRMYAGRGYRTDSLAPQADGANRLTLVAWRDDDVVATLTVGCDSPTGLLADALYASELAGLRRAGRTVCEVSRLAVDPEHRSPGLLNSLWQAAHRYGREFFAAHDVVIEVNPRHAAYYQRCLGFRQLGRLRHCRRVDAPALLLHRALDEPATPLAARVATAAPTTAPESEGGRSTAKPATITLQNRRCTTVIYAW